MLDVHSIELLFIVRELVFARIIAVIPSAVLELVSCDFRDQARGRGSERGPAAAFSASYSESMPFKIFAPTYHHRTSNHAHARRPPCRRGVRAPISMSGFRKFVAGSFSTGRRWSYNKQRPSGLASITTGRKKMRKKLGWQTSAFTNRQSTAGKTGG